MAATPYRCTVTIDGTKFNAVATSVRFTTEKDRAGMAQMGSLRTSIRVWGDFHDDNNLPHAALKKFFDLANVVTRDKIKDMKIEFWKDDSHQDALCSYSFKGWISRFETSNPHLLASTDTNGDHPAPPDNLNHMLVMDLEPALNQANFKEITMSN
ncbi:MAG: hypothetical protein ACLP6G_13140 [Terriglobales bacterium]